MLRATASLATFVLAVPLLAQHVEPGRVRVIISFQDSIDRDVLDRFGVVADGELFGAEAVIATVPAGLVANLRRDESVETVEIDHIASAYKPGNGGGSNGGGGGPQVTPEGITRVGGAMSVSGVTVAVIDSGIDLDHPDLAANIIGGARFVSGTGGNDDDNGHGTHCAGTIAAIDNNVGVVGVAHNAALLAVKVLDRRGSGSYSGITSGINWAVANGANVLSMSLGGSATTTTLQNACNAAANSAFVVAAAGNDGDCNLTTDEISYPAYYSSVVSIGATSIEAGSVDALMCFSNSNNDVEFSAPGYNIYSCWKGGGYRDAYGTSMACPHVAGCAAVLWNGSPASVRNTLLNYCDDRGPVGYDTGWGYGIVEHTDNH
ncbi:MAG: S8 family peptidase [Planctomycetes bacterium]|nr:S8 family peptidase [Planctomycetota bacterium]